MFGGSFFGSAYPAGVLDPTAVAPEPPVVEPAPSVPPSEWAFTGGLATVRVLGWPRKPLLQPVIYTVDGVVEVETVVEVSGVGTVTPIAVVGGSLAVDAIVEVQAQGQVVTPTLQQLRDMAEIELCLAETVNDIEWFRVLDAEYQRRRRLEGSKK